VLFMVSPKVSFSGLSSVPRKRESIFSIAKGAWIKMDPRLRGDDGDVMCFSQIFLPRPDWMQKRTD